MPTRKGKAVWTGSLKDGKGTLALGSGAFEGRYSFGSRFEEGPGTNPEELIAAAHAACFSMAFSGGLGRAGFEPRRIATTAAVHLGKTDAGFRIGRIDLVTEGEVPGIDAATFEREAQAAKANCPVSKLLTGAEITVQARLV
jgi:osmotically inducible protein OsmC